jgi:hypothetical protein
MSATADSVKYTMEKSESPQDSITLPTFNLQLLYR